MLLHVGEPHVVPPAARVGVKATSCCKPTAQAGAVSLPFLFLAAHMQKPCYEDDIALRRGLSFAMFCTTKSCLEARQ